MKVSDRRDSGPAPGSSSARASGSLLKSIKLASLGLLPGSQTERCSFSKRSAMSVPTTVLRNNSRKLIQANIHHNPALRYLQSCLQTYPVLSTEEHNEVPEEAGRVPVKEVVVTQTLQGFVLGELYHVHLMGLLPVVRS